ncbi:hypothetical protein [Aneurinibacillus aneurinilyticus]|jgi:hypothetical protein|uniref:Lipoprotein n=1 Tax=Aneurinibacillus aneurinilyticus ATCC 12856 TaxID=649747 RepID=U1YI87_ANEAE|nr:hypothetical protein [Aneurinibacillus aneurinilyticus]ERI11802.1 hypothetical protein HMPREF0083_00095 [Aneurinibacillus aneurinilyticus ATCC 12856]MED0709774.1 hypothetical protein [Aneurinibacillus aneurinilyticus]MED0725343.1 hypothetical protein [Aneurinibacillus aneurinilyticus]MED0735380.1 hypothetical protein [Aneurinibacillus aneurinilyticus]MED0744299.1 hypothetical protein [Aneurinibacillus aneurinilyticus]
MLVVLRILCIVLLLVGCSAPKEITSSENSEHKNAKNTKHSESMIEQKNLEITPTFVIQEKNKGLMIVHEMRGIKGVLAIEDVLITEKTPINCILYLWANDVIGKKVNISATHKNTGETVTILRDGKIEKQVGPLYKNEKETEPKVTPLEYNQDLNSVNNEMNNPPIAKVPLLIKLPSTGIWELNTMINKEKLPSIKFKVELKDKNLKNIN